MLVYDVQMPLPWLEGEELARWCRSNGIEPHDTYRIEIDEQAMTALIYQYKLNEQGAKYMDIETRKVAKKEPFEIKITSLPDLQYPASPSFG